MVGYTVVNSNDKQAAARLTGEEKTKAQNLPSSHTFFFLFEAKAKVLSLCEWQRKGRRGRD
jgi:hypothetical protein